MAALIPTHARPLRAQQAQQGYVLLLTLITLVVLLFGVLFTMRGNLLQNVMTGNTAQRQKDVQAGDLALRQVQQALIATVQGAGNQVLDVAASGQPWFYAPVVSPSAPASAVPGSNAPYANFWTTCIASKQCAPLSSVVSVLNPAPPAINDASGNPYQVLVSVWPTNRPTNAYACGTTGFTASYYTIFLRVAEANGSTAINTQSVIKLCTS
ncbi:MAG: hypothetical protein ACP5QB_08010 [Thiomonas sp.]